MEKDKTNLGEPQAYWNNAGTKVLKYVNEMYHEGLNEHKLVSAPDLDILQNKVDIQLRKWSEKWRKLESKTKAQKKKEATIEEAKKRTEDSEKALSVVNRLLLHTLSIDDTVDWESLKKNKKYEEKPPEKPTSLVQEEYPSKPEKITPKFGVIDFIFKSIKEKKIRASEEKYIYDISEWENRKIGVDENNKKLMEYNLAEKNKWNEEFKKWETRKNKFLKGQETFNQSIDNLKSEYYKRDVNAVVEYCDMVLNNSIYPDTFPKNYELEYIPESKIIIVEYQLPPRNCLPKLKEVKFLSSKNEMKEVLISESKLAKMFDDVGYKITLRTIHELFEADVAEALDAVSFNGWVKDINKATGIEENNCILSIQVKKEDFLKIDLSNVDPKICFRNLKGVSSSKLSSLTPINPILKLSTSDKRFVDSYDVADKLNDATNIAAMDWEDFEHLVRELFEKEFQVNGGEVKVTQASRDGGVDAIAFDPDPIRGGKIVIQAKRYTNTVGVSAVRDLYGTVLNEGATKGILVSTANYGADAYEFAKGKPITLLNGANLLHLLNKHGHHAKIDLREAKKILSEKDNQIG